MIREAMYKRTVLDLKRGQKTRIEEHIQKYRNDLYSQELLINEMIEQSYDIRLDLNDALLMFCQVSFLHHCVFYFKCLKVYLLSPNLPISLIISKGILDCNLYLCMDVHASFIEAQQCVIISYFLHYQPIFLSGLLL